MRDSPLRPDGIPPSPPKSGVSPSRSNAPLSSRGEGPLEELSTPQLSSKKRLKLALSLLKAGDCLEVWTARSKDYAPLKKGDRKAKRNHDASEPIGEFCWHFGATHVMPPGTFKGETRFFGDTTQIRLPRPPDFRPPRSPLPYAPLSSMPSASLRGALSLAEVVDPGVDGVRRALSVLPLLTDGATGMTGMLGACRDYQEWQQRNDDRWSDGSPSFWFPFRPDLTAFMRFVPPHIAPLLAGSVDPHRAIELHALHHCFSFFLFSQPEPVSDASINDKNIEIFDGGNILPSGPWRKRDPAVRHHSRGMTQTEADFYNREVFLKSETLNFVGGTFITLADGIARSVPVYGILKTFDAYRDPSPVAGLLCRRIVHPFKWILQDYLTMTDLSRQRVSLDLEKGKFRKILEGIKTPKEAAEVLSNKIEQYANNAWPRPSRLLIDTNLPDHPLYTHRPPVYDAVEFERILVASRYLLKIFLSPDLDAQGPRKGSKAYKHMLEVGMLLMASGERPEVVMSGLLHDVYELYQANHPKRLPAVAKKIRQGLGVEIDELIAAVTEPAKRPKDFFPRKTAITDKLQSLDFPLAAQVARILCASKLSTLQDGIRYLYEKGTTQGWSEGSWAQNFALYSFYLSIFERYQVSDSLLVTYRSKLVNFASWAHTFKSSADITELRENLSDYLASLNRGSRS